MSHTPTPAKPEGRAGHVISQAYYYVAAVMGFGLFLGGAIGALFGVREMLLPREFESVSSGVRTILHGVSFALPGLAVMWWHLREARRREARPISGAVWGRALYFHLGAFIALIFAVSGTIGVLFNLASAATAGSFYDGFPTDSRADSLRSAVDSAIFLVVAGPVFWWHLRQGRRLTAGEPAKLDGPTPPVA